MKYINQKFGDWTVIKELPSKLSGKIVRRYMLCKCKCGNKKEVNLYSLTSGRSIQCRSCSLTIHGGAFTGEYRTWKAMKSRCYNKNNKAYKNYGGRGIIICKRWLNSFENFLKDMGKKPTPEHSIDRIDNDGNYEPGNCKWSTDNEQQNNRRNNLK